MSIVNSIETVRDWLTAEVCPLVKLKLPDDNATDASYPYKLVNPAAFSLFVPSKDRTPPNSGVSRLPRARHLLAEGRRQRYLHPAIQRGGGLLLREERRGLA